MDQARGVQCTVSLSHGKAGSLRMAAAGTEMMEAGLPPPPPPHPLQPWLGRLTCCPCWQVGEGPCLPLSLSSGRSGGGSRWAKEPVGHRAGHSVATRVRGSANLTSLPVPPPHIRPQPTGKWPAPELLCVLARVCSAGHQK